MDISIAIDIAVIVILLISAAVSFFRGLIKELLTVLGALGGGFAALTFGGSVVPIVSGWFGIEDGKDAGKLFDLIPMEMVAQIASYAGIFIIIFMILQLASHLISSAVNAVGLGPVDRTLGIFFGLARGLLLLGILYLPAHLILPDDTKKEWFDHSQTIPFIEGTTEWLMSFAPQSDNDDKEQENKTLDKLNELDILGDKKITPDNNNTKKPTTAPKAEGYSDKARKTLDDIIKENIEQPKGNYND